MYQNSRQWDPNTQHQPIAPVNGGYSQPPASQPYQSDSRPMAAPLPHPGYYQGPYLPAPSGLYPPHDVYRPPPPPPTAAGNVGQSAPRQRTAIACKYCRRRKIRCSGFENSEDGRCSNCVRFNQECIFTPVSQATQAFVPAQALYGRNARGAGGHPRQLYGPYGNPLPPHHDPRYAPPQPYPVQGTAGAPYPPPGPYGYPPPPHGYQADPQQAARRRGRDEPHTPTLPPPNSTSKDHDVKPEYPPPPQQQPGYAYPDPSSYGNQSGSPATGSGYPPYPQPYYQQQQAAPPGHGYGGPPPTSQAPTSGPPPPPSQPAGRTSPGGGASYGYDAAPRNSNSPHAPYNSHYHHQHHAHGQGQTPASAGAAAPSYQGGPSGPAGRSPPHSSGAERGNRGLSIHDMVESSGGASASGAPPTSAAQTNGNTPAATASGSGSGNPPGSSGSSGANGQGLRSAADSNMVSALDRPPAKR